MRPERRRILLVVDASARARFDRRRLARDGDERSPTERRGVHRESRIANRGTTRDDEWGVGRIRDVT